MIRLLLSRAISRISIRGSYTVWTRGAVLTMVMWAAFTGDDSSIAKTGLTFILILLLAGGVVLLAFGIRDLIRDFLCSLRLRSERNGHARL